MNIPILIQIETTTVCNASCWMCPRPTATRSNHRTRMPTTLFQSAVRQAVDLGIKWIMPFIDGEPLTDTRMVEFVTWMAREFPEVECGWYTNASLLTPETTRALLSAGNIKHFNFSFQGGDKETYERNMGLPWEKTLVNVRRLIEINREMGQPVQVRANMCVGGPSLHSVDAFRALWAPYPEVLICLGAFSNFGGYSKDAAGEKPWLSQPRQVCKRGTEHMYVFWDGTVGQCCFDLQQTVSYGSLQDQSLREIWESPAYRATRQAHKDLHVPGMPPICRNCNSTKFNG